jgi:hypothetical protein
MVSIFFMVKLRVVDRYSLVDEAVDILGLPPWRAFYYYSIAIANILGKNAKIGGESRLPPILDGPVLNLRCTECLAASVKDGKQFFSGIFIVWMG